jgi:heme exporter protein B
MNPFAENTILKQTTTFDLAMSFSKILILFGKDLRLEFRSQSTLYGIVVYTISTIFLIYLSNPQPDAVQWNALFWITQLFVVVNAVVKSFVGESKGRFQYYATLTHPNEYLCSKMLLNVVFMIVLSLISIGIFSFFLGNPLNNAKIYLGITLLGGIGFSLLFTMLSAIASKAQQQPSLIAILGFPIIIPQFILLMRLSKLAFAEVFQSGTPLMITGLLVLLNLLVIVMTNILFQYIWKD